MSFSYFENGIKDINPKIQIDFPQLIQIIKKNPKRSLIDEIRLLRSNGDDYYKILKNTLPNISPFCVVKKRKLSEGEFDTNFVTFSQYIYIDIDKPGIEYKNYIIQRYGHLISMVCVSCSGGGVSILFKISNVITRDNYQDIWNHIRFNILKDEVVDTKCKDIGRPMFISSDEDVYVNYENELRIEESVESQKSTNQSISYKSSSINRVNGTFYRIIAIEEVLLKINLKTPVNIKNAIVEIMPIDYTEIGFVRKIYDNEKHIKYTAMIHTLVYLNQDIEPDYLFNYMNFINNYYGSPKMDFRELVRLFKFVYSSIKNNPGYKYYDKRTKTKSIHFNQHSDLSGKEKSIISNQLNGKKRRNKTIKKIQQAKDFLIQNGIKVTRISIALHSGLAINTVKRNFNETITDMDELIQMYNDSIV